MRNDTGMRQHTNTRFHRTRTSHQVVCNDVLGTLSTEYELPKEKIEETLRGCGLSLDKDPRGLQLPLYREIMSCRTGRYESYASQDVQLQESLDEQLRGFDEIYVDTAPIIQEDWFLKFLADAEPMLRMRKKRLIILEKTMEELHGLKDNPEKDRDVRIRALIRPELIRTLARKGLVQIRDTGSRGIADDHLVAYFASNRMRMSLLLITQDRGLSERIVRIASQPVEAVASEPQEQNGLLSKLFHRDQEPSAPIERKMMVCKFDSNGSLQRFYLCPDCGESFYGSLVDGNGMVLCTKCYQERIQAEQKAMKQAQLVAKRQAMKAEQAARKELERKEAEAAAKNVHTVEDVLAKRKRKQSWIIVAVCAALAVLLGLSYLLWIV